VCGVLWPYSLPEPLPQGTRVLVPFRNKTVVGIVWETDIAPDMDAARILSIQTTFSDEPPLPIREYTPAAKIPSTRTKIAISFPRNFFMSTISSPANVVF